jgi:UDP-N-acetylmuramoyl-L-alanyl-D-glutamate--2,6-diaminopimelate ligase
MKLHQLFSKFSHCLVDRASTVEPKIILEQDVSGIYFDARQVRSSSVFVAVKGINTDGHQYISQAIDNGVVALVVEKIEHVPEVFQGLVYQVNNSREALDILACEYYDDPSSRLFIFGVTGTNGKTSITYILEHILNENRKLTGVMGTVNHRIGSKMWDSQMTTPDSVTLQSRLKNFLEYHAYAAALEVSSHALEQNRVDSVHFNTVVFTNLTLDHLDYHSNMENYFEAKQKLFTDLIWKSKKKILFAIVNNDDPYGRRLKVADRAVTWTYGQKEADFKFKVIKMNFHETVFELETPIESKMIKMKTCGIHMVYNVVASLVAAITAGVTLEEGVRAVETFQGIPGRLEKIDHADQRVIFVDYAHTPDALKNTLNSIRHIRNETKSESKIMTVFGCGGDRDKSKRPEMGLIASQLSDVVILTSDNPRSEEPLQILQDIKAGIPKSFEKLFVEPDREKAILLALSQATNSDIVLVAGKGHENYQIVGTSKIHFSDKEVILKILG